MDTPETRNEPRHVSHELFRLRYHVGKGFKQLARTARDLALESNGSRSCPRQFIPRALLREVAMLDAAFSRVEFNRHDVERVTE